MPSNTHDFSALSEPILDESVQMSAVSTADWTTLGVLVFISSILIMLLYQYGCLNRDVLKNVPARLKTLTMLDVFWLISITLIGVILASTLARGWAQWLPDWYEINEQGNVSGSTPTAQVLLILQMQVMMFGPATLFVFIRAGLLPNGLQKLGLLPRLAMRDLKITLLGILVAIPIVLTTLVIFATASKLFGDPPPTLNHAILEILAESQEPLAIATIVFMAVILAPFMEEVIYRGCIQTVLVNTLFDARWFAIAITSVLFAVVHMNSVSWHGLPGLFVFSVILGWVYERTGNLWPAIGIHMGYNLFNILLAWLFIQFGTN